MSLKKKTMMQCPEVLWNALLKKYWPTEFLQPTVTQGIAQAVEKYHDLPTSKDAPIFVFAAGWRSGSTLLQRLLNSHPDVMVWGEAYEESFLLHHLSAPLAGLARYPLDFDFLPNEQSPVSGEMDSLLTTKWIATLAPSVNDLKRAHWAYMELLFKSRVATAGRARWGLKMVRGTATVARYVRWLYPNAKILYLFRNPYDAFHSYLNRCGKGWYLYYPSHRVKGVVPFIVHWKRCMDDFLATHEEVDALLIAYESLVDRQILASLQEYLNLELDQSVLDLNVGSKGGKRNTRNLTTSERLLIKFIAGDMATRYGYQRKTARATAAR